MSVPDGGAKRLSATDGPSVRVPLIHKFLYGLAYVPVGLATILTMSWIGMLYDPPAAAAGSVKLVTYAGLLIAVNFGRVVDAVADPLMGYWSDHVRTRWGRRKPFILVGGPLLAVAFALLWAPPAPAGIAFANAVYLAATLALFFFTFTVVVCPYLAMLPEITADPAERVSLGAWQGGFNVVGVVGGMILTGYLVGRYDYRTMGLIYIPIILLCAWAPLLVPTPVAAEKPSELPLKQSISSTFRNPWFRPYVTSQLLFWMALSIVIWSSTQLPIVRAGATEETTALPLAAALLVAGLLFPAMRSLADRFGKRAILLWAMVWMAVVMVPLIFAGTLPLPIAPMWQIAIAMLLAGPSVAALFALPNPIVGDIVDHDETLTGQRREAIYFGVQGLLVKAGMGVGGGLAAVLLGVFGAELARQGGFIACPIVAMVLVLAAAAIFRRYPGD